MKTPVWELFADGTDKSVFWADHKPNYRFAIFNNNTPGTADDLVLDRETGLIWPRNASVIPAAQTWLDSNTTSRELRLANRIGWRLPTVEELSSLVDIRNTIPALPTGHPFLSLQIAEASPAYWTSTNGENSGSAAWFVNLRTGGAGLGTKSIDGFAWPVRGGRGGVNWNT